MSPNSDSACRQAGSLAPDCACAVSNSGPVRTHYKARIRPIKLLFPHLASLSKALVRRNVPITSTRWRETKRLITKRLVAKRPDKAWPVDEGRDETFGK